jgi:hypothetical protein
MHKATVAGPRAENPHNQAMLDNVELAKRVKGALEAAVRKTKLSLAEIAARYFDVSAQALTGWKTTGRVHRKHFAALSEISGYPVDYFLVAEATKHTARAVREERTAYAPELDSGVREIQVMVTRGLITQEQLEELLKRAKECAEVTAARRTLALDKSPTHHKKRA